MYVNKVLRQYGLPSTMDLLDVSYTKAQWRGMYVQAVDWYWKDKILAEAAEKSSLKYMNTQKYSIWQAQLVWCDAGHDIMSVQKAGWKARLMTGTYMLQATRARFNQHQVDPACLLCCKEPENVEHFLLRCESLTQVHKIYQSLQKSVGVGHFDIIKSHDTVLTTAILDCTTLIDDVREPVMDIVLHEIESTARGLCFALHMKRTAVLSQSN